MRDIQKFFEDEFDYCISNRLPAINKIFIGGGDLPPRLDMIRANDILFINTTILSILIIYSFQALEELKTMSSSVFSIKSLEIWIYDVVLLRLWFLTLKESSHDLKTK